MVIRTKSGIMTANGEMLLDYLGIKKDTAGKHKVTGDVVLITSVPFQINNFGVTLCCATPDNFCSTLKVF